MSVTNENPDAIALKVKSSLEATAKGLSLFAKSFEESGLRKSLPAYREMRMVLIRQRLWSDRLDRKELQPLWNEIAAKCSSLYELMGPYAEVMGSLKDLDKLKYAPPAPEGMEARVMRALSTPRFVSAQKLAREIGEGAESMKGLLKELEEKGSVERRGWGRSASFKVRQ